MLLNLQIYEYLLYEQDNPNCVRYSAAANILIYFTQIIPTEMGLLTFGVELLNGPFKIVLRLKSKLCFFHKLYNTTLPNTFEKKMHRSVVTVNDISHCFHFGIDILSNTHNTTGSRFFCS